MNHLRQTAEGYCNRCKRYNSCVCQWIEGHQTEAYERLVENGATIDRDGTVTIDLETILEMLSPTV